FGKQAPDLSWVLLDLLAVAPCDAKAFEGDALAVKHSEDVVVRYDKQRGGVGERRVVGEPRGIGMPVRAHDRQVANLFVKPPRNRPDRRIRRKQPIGVEPKRRNFPALDARLLAFACFLPARLPGCLLRHVAPKRSFWLWFFGQV